MAADIDLSIIVRAKDLLTAELKRMGVSLDEIARKGREAFAPAAQASGALAQRVREAEAATRTLGASAVTLRPLEQELSEARARLESMREAATSAGGAISQVDRVNLNQLEREVREGEAALVKLRAAGERTSAGLATTFKAAGAAIKSALLPILPLLTIGGVAFAATDAVREAAEFQRGLAGISAESGITGRALDELKRQALETTRSLGLNEARAVPALLKAVTDGALDAADGIGRFDAAAKLAQATSGDLARTTDVLNSVLNALGGDADKAADVLFGVAQAAGRLDIDELSGGIEGVLPLIRGMNVSLEELGAVIVTATRAGGGFQQGMQAVRTILGTLTGGSEEAGEALQGLDVRAQGLVPTLAAIGQRLGGDEAAIRRLFPEVRSFGAVLALLGDEGRGVSASLAQLQQAAGGVEAAIGRRLQDPAERLRVVMVNLRSEFSQAFGSAFFRGVNQAVEEMGGFEQAIRTARDIGKTLGDVFGVVFPAIGSVVGNAAQSLRDFIESIGGVESIEGRMRAVSDALAGVLGSALRIARAEIDALVRTILLIPQTVLAVKAELSGERLFHDFETEGEGVKRAIGEIRKALLQLGGETIRFGKFDQREFQQKIAKISDEFGSNPASKLAFKAEVDDLALRATLADLERQEAEIKLKIEEGSSFERLRQSIEGIKGSIGTVDAEVDNLDSSLRQLGGAFTSGSEREAARTIESVSAAYREAQEDVQLYTAALAVLRAQAQRGGDLNVLAEHARSAQAGLNASKDAARELSQELALLTGAEIRSVEREIAKIKDGLVDARSVAELLGVTSEEAIAKLGSGAADGALAQLEQRLAGLKARLEELRGAGAKVGEPLVTASRIKVGVSLHPKQVELRKRFKTEVLDPLTAAAVQAGIDTAVAFARGIEGHGLKLKPDTDSIGPILAFALDLGQRTAESFSDEFARSVRIADAIKAAQEEVNAAQIEREAIFFGGISLDSETLEADIIRAREQAQEFADQLAGRGVQREALSLGIALDEKSTQQLLEDIALVRERAQAFAQQNPIAAEALTVGIRGFSQAIGQIAVDFDNAGDHLRQFARSAIQQLIQVAVQAAIVRGLIAALGGSAGGAGAFVASTFGVAGAKGLAFKAARGAVIGGDEPGMAVYAKGGVPDARRTLWTDVAAFAAGGVPDLTRTVVTEYAKGGSPHIEKIVDRPTLARARDLAGTAIVPLSGGGVETTDGRRLPMVSTPDGLAVRRYARGGVHALFGEAGPEGLPRLRRSPDGRPGILAADGAVLPLTRVRGGRLGVEAYQAGGTFGAAPASAGVTVTVNVPVTVRGGGGEEIERRVKSREFRDAVAAAVQAEIEKRPGFRSGVRGDKV